MHLACECIDIFYRGCVYGEILSLITVFINFRGAFAPPNHQEASPLSAETQEIARGTGRSGGSSKNRNSRGRGGKVIYYKKILLND